MKEKYDNVTWAKDKNKYKSVIRFDGKRYHVGYSKDDPKSLSEKAKQLRVKLENKRLKEVESICDKGEEFKWIKGLENCAAISDKGRVKVYGPVRFGIIAEDSGHFTYYVEGGNRQKKYYRHKLVAEYFMGVSDPNGCKFFFKDGDRLNCSVENIQFKSKESIREEEDIEREEAASKCEGVFYSRNKRMFYTEVEIKGKRFRFTSTKSPEEILEKRKVFKEKRYREFCEEIDKSLLPGEVFERTKTFKTVLVSNKGRVIRDRFPVREILTFEANKYGYYRVSERMDGKNDTKGVHQLVAEVFLGHKIDGHTVVVDHVNFDTTDNRVENLRLTSNRENSSRKSKPASSLYPGVRKLYNGKFYVEAIVNGKEHYIGRFSDEQEAAKAYQDFIRGLPM